MKDISKILEGALINQDLTFKFRVPGEIVSEKEIKEVNVSATDYLIKVKNIIPIEYENVYDGENATVFIIKNIRSNAEKIVSGLERLVDQFLDINNMHGTIKKEGQFLSTIKTMLS